MKKHYHDYTYKKFKEFLNALTMDCNGDFPPIYWKIRYFGDETTIVCTDGNTDRVFHGLSQKNINAMIAVAKKGAL